MVPSACKTRAGEGVQSLGSGLACLHTRGALSLRIGRPGRGSLTSWVQCRQSPDPPEPQSIGHQRLSGGFLCRQGSPGQTVGSHELHLTHSPHFQHQANTHT